MPGAEWLEGHHDNGIMSRYDIVCIHTIVGYAPAHAAHFSTKANGWIGQSRDTTHRSAANLNGNHRVIAIENEDFGPAFGGWSTSDVPAFTAPQVESIAQICAWNYRTHGIPLVACPDSRPGSRGIAFHRQGCDGNYPNGRVSGGELWSTSKGKVCPGDRRIAQMPQIIKRARVIAGLEGDEDMDATERNAVLSTHAAIYSHGGAQGDQSIIDRLVEMQGATRRTEAGLAALAGSLSDDESNILAAIRAQPTGGQVDVAQLAASLSASLGASLAADLGRRLTS